jgi:hypothetical protein
VVTTPVSSNSRATPIARSAGAAAETGTTGRFELFSIVMKSLVLVLQKAVFRQ